MAKVALDPFRARAFRIAVAQVVSMAVHPPRTRAGTDRPKSSELILTHLDGAQNPHSLDRIKPRCFVLHDATAPPLLANAPLPRSQISSQPYKSMSKSKSKKMAASAVAERSERPAHRL